VITHRFVPGASSSGGHPADEETDTVTGERPSMLRNLRLVGTFPLPWAVPVGALWIWRGGEDVLVREALFFTGAAFVTFGGAYAVLGYIASVAVND
jgi:chromate transporter